MNTTAPLDDRWRTPLILTIGYVIASVGLGPAIFIAAARDAPGGLIEPLKRPGYRAPMKRGDADILRGMARLPMVAVALCAAAVLPSMVPAALVPSADLPGLPTWVIPVWIVGFLVQMVFVIWLLRDATNDGRVLAFGIASFVPWCVHWIAGVYLPADFAASALVVGLAALAISSLQRRYRVLVFGIEARAKVLEILKSRWNVVVNNSYVRRRLRVEVSAPGIAPYTAVMTDLFDMFDVPRPGAVLPVRVDPARPEGLALDPGA